MERKLSQSGRSSVGGSLTPHSPNVKKSVSDEEFYSIMSKWSEQHFQDAIKESAAEKHNLKLVRQNIANIKRLMRTFHSQPRLLEAIFDKYDFHDAKSSRTQNIVNVGTKSLSLERMFCEFDANMVNASILQEKDLFDLRFSEMKKEVTQIVSEKEELLLAISLDLDEMQREKASLERLQIEKEQLLRLKLRQLNNEKEELNNAMIVREQIIQSQKMQWQQMESKVKQRDETILFQERDLSKAKNEVKNERNLLKLQREKADADREDMDTTLKLKEQQLNEMMIQLNRLQKEREEDNATAKIRSQGDQEDVFAKGPAAKSASFTRASDSLKKKATKDERKRLWDAVKSNDTETMRVIIDAFDIDVDEYEIFGSTALHTASHYGYVSAVELLLRQGANINAKDTIGYTPLHWASRAHFSAVKLLVDYGCDIHAKTNYGDTALHTASRKGHVPVMELLLDHKADINAKNDNGWTPLMKASYYGEYEAVKLLVSRGCDIHLKNKKGNTALGLARQENKQEVDNYLQNMNE